MQYMQSTTGTRMNAFPTVMDATVNLELRPAVPADAADIFSFITELAVYERAGHEVVATVADIERTLFCADAKAHAVMCLRDGKAIGFAVYFFSYSTWLGRNGLYLEDLYVTPEQRGVGAGKRLLRYLAQLALREGCGRFEWSVLDWNTPAIEFYDSIGAQPQAEWLRYRMAGPALRHFAESGD